MFVLTKTALSYLRRDSAGGIILGVFYLMIIELRSFGLALIEISVRSLT